MDPDELEAMNDVGTELHTVERDGTSSTKIFEFIQNETK
jgi:hypothetical protein